MKPRPEVIYVSRKETLLKIFELECGVWRRAQLNKYVEKISLVAKYLMN